MLNHSPSVGLRGPIMGLKLDHSPSVGLRGPIMGLKLDHSPSVGLRGLSAAQPNLRQLFYANYLYPNLFTK